MRVGIAEFFSRKISVMTGKWETYTVHVMEDILLGDNINEKKLFLTTDNS